jgi:hypothetical protein
MPDARGFWRHTAAWLTLVCLFSTAAPLRAQSVGEVVVKAGFLLNFAKFTQWSRQRDKLLMCSPSTQVLGGQFALLQGRLVDGRDVEVRQGVASADWRGCDLLFLTESDEGRADVILRAVAGAPVLTVADFPGFSHLGGMIVLRFEGSRVRFDVNLVAVERGGLVLNNQMVKLAGRVLQ